MSWVDGVTTRTYSFVSVIAKAVTLSTLQMTQFPDIVALSALQMTQFPDLVALSALQMTQFHEQVNIRLISKLVI